MQPRPEAYETLPFFTTAWLACFAQVGICSIVHSFSRRWCPLREGRSRGRNVWMEAFLGMIEIHRTPQLRWKCKAPSSIAIQHNAQLFWKRSWQWPQTLTLGEFANTCNYHGDGVPTDKMTLLRRGEDSQDSSHLKNLSQPTAAAHQQKQIPGPHLRSLTQNFQGERMFIKYHRWFLSSGKFGKLSPPIGPITLKLSEGTRVHNPIATNRFIHLFIQRTSVAEAADIVNKTDKVLAVTELLSGLWMRTKK